METRIILKFIFKPADHPIIDALPITDRLRGFSQGLLLEAIDASYATGFVQSLFESTANPTKAAMKIIKSFGRKAASHWFKNASSSELQNIKIYEFVLSTIARGFRSQLRDHRATNTHGNSFGAFIVYQVTPFTTTSSLG